MPSLGPQQLRLFALDALEEALVEAEAGPVRRSWALRLALAYLASRHPYHWGRIDPYRDFWRALSADGRSARLRNLGDALSVIYAWADASRDAGRTAVIHERVRGQIRDLQHPRHSD